MTNGTAPESRSSDLDLSQVFGVLRERKWVLIGLTIVAVAISLAISLTSTSQYRATAQVLQQNATVAEALFGATVFQITDRERALQTAADLVELDQVASKVREELGTSRSIASLKNMVEVATVKAADIISISAVGPDPSEAADVANSFARQFILFRQAADRAVLSEARTQIEAQLDAMTSEEKASARGQTLSQKVEELGVLESMQTGGFEVAQIAVPPSVPFAPRTYLNAAVALIVGLALGLIVILLLHVVDRRIKYEEGMEAEFGAPVIASVPRIGRRWVGKGRRRVTATAGLVGPGLPVLEAFRTLRSNLRFFEVNRNVQTLLVTSALPREGKTNTAINLALSFALSGSRVILLEADLRRPMLGEYLGLSGKAGFSSLLVGSETISDVAQTVDTSRLLGKDFDLDSGRGGSTSVKKNLLCVTCGPLPPNPSELLATEKAGEVVKQLAALCDYLIVDGPPILLVSDALEMAGKVGSVIVVARLSSTKIEDARAARESLARVGIKPIGVVVTDARRAKKYYREYGGYYARFP